MKDMQEESIIRQGKITELYRLRLIKAIGFSSILLMYTTMSTVLYSIPNIRR